MITAGGIAFYIVTSGRPAADPLRLDRPHRWFPRVVITKSTSFEGLAVLVDTAGITPQ